MKYTDYTIETQNAFARLNATSPKTVQTQSHEIGFYAGEPLIVAMDAMIRYAKAHRKAYGSTLCEDYALGERWLAATKALRGLLDGQGAVAMELDRSTDSKDNGTVEAMFWSAIELAGFTQETANL